MSLIKLGEGNSVPSKIQLMRVGNFNYDNEPINLTKDLLLSLKNNFESKVRGYEDGKLPIDYFHENDKLAAGWIANLSLEAEGTELWGEVQWTPKAEKMLADGELRYVSVEFHFDYQDNESGKKFGPTLFGAGLTNRPFLKGMKPVKKFSEGENQMTLEQAMAKIAELEKKIADMGKMEAELADTKKKMEDSEAKAALAEKKGSFDKMLAEGKAVEAQREPFMAGDMAKFAENAKPLNAGSGNAGNEGTKDNAKSFQDQVLELAETVRKEKKISMSESISQVLNANKVLRAGYEKEVALG